MFPASNWDSLDPLAKLEDLNNRVKIIEGRGPSDPFARATGGSTMGQADPSQTVPQVDTRLRLPGKNALGIWIIPTTGAFSGVVVSGGRYISFPDGSHFDIISDVDSQGFVTLHK